MAMQNEKADKILKSITIVILLFITFKVIFISYLGMTILKEHKLFSEKYEENLKSIEEDIKQREKNINKEFEYINLGIISINEKNLESEKRLSAKIDNTNKRLMEKIDNINKSINSLNETYNNILKEEKKKRIEYIYTDKDLADKMKEGEFLIKEGKMNQAYAVYELVTREQPENKDARFYMYYTLFLKNRFDRDEYPKIKKGFYELEKEGYIRKEMLEVFSYIESEKNYNMNIESGE